MRVRVDLAAEHLLGAGHCDTRHLGAQLLAGAIDLDVDLGASRIELHQEVRRGADDLVHAQVAIACVNTASFKPVRIPGPVIARLGRK